MRDGSAEGSLIMVHGGRFLVERGGEGVEGVVDKGTCVGRVV